MPLHSAIWVPGISVSHNGAPPESPLQTVTREANGRFYELVRKFGEATGVPVLLNTSFNVIGEPIVETPEDALACLLGSGLDCCVFEDRIVVRN